MNLSLRHALVALVLLPACSSAGNAEPPAPPRQSPAAIPTASPVASIEVEEPPAAELIAPETGEQLAMLASGTMTVLINGTAAAATLVQSEQIDTVLEQNEGETRRVLRLALADRKRADDVQFTVDGIAAPGTYKTGDAELRVVFFNAPLGVDLLSDRGECTVVFESVAATGASGSVTCADVATPTGKAHLTATFKAEATDLQ